MASEQLTVIMPDGRLFGPADLATLRQWLLEGRVPDAAMIRDEATGQQQPAAHYRTAGVDPTNPFASPAGQAPPTSDAVSTLIPYKNPPALTAYYLGVFSLSACIPLLGIAGVVMAIFAVVCGRRGLRLAAEKQEARGRVHAWIGIIGGSICGLFGLLIQGLVVVGIIGALLDKR